MAMSTTAARRATDVCRNAEQVVAIELLCAATGLWCRLDEGATTLGRGTRAALDVVEEALGGRGSGVPSDDIARVAEALTSGRLVERVEAAIGPLSAVHHG